jgi:hypothetical protein
LKECYASETGPLSFEQKIRELALKEKLGSRSKRYQMMEKFGIVPSKKEEKKMKASKLTMETVDMIYSHKVDLAKEEEATQKIEELKNIVRPEKMPLIDDV